MYESVNNLKEVLLKVSQIESFDKAIHAIIGILVRRMFTRLVDGVAYLHGNGIMHRDLSVANLFLTHDMQIVCLYLLISLCRIRIILRLGCNDAFLSRRDLMDERGESYSKITRYWGV